MRRVSLYFLLAFVFSLPWQNAISIGGTRTLSSFLGIAALVLTALSCLTRGNVAKPPALFYAAVLLVLWQATTYFWSFDSSATLSRVLTMTQLLAMIWIIQELCESDRERQLIMQAFVLGCLVVCGVLIEAYASGQPLEGYRYAPADFSLNGAANVLAMGIAIALAMSTSGKRTVLLWVDVAYVPLAVFSVVLTASRGGFIVTCLALGGTFFALHRLRVVYRVAWALVILAACVSLFYSLAGSERLAPNLRRVTFRADQGTLRTLTGRTEIWSAGLELFAEHPLTGVGARAFPAASQGSLGRTISPHSLYVSAAAETGVIGLVLLAAILVAAILPIALARSGPRGPYVVLFMVLLVSAAYSNPEADKTFWLLLTLLSLRLLLPQAKPGAPPTFRRDDPRMNWAPDASVQFGFARIAAEQAEESWARQIRSAPANTPSSPSQHPNR